MKKEEQDALTAYVSQVEGAPESTVEPAEPEKPTAPARKTTAQQAREQRLHGRTDLPTEEQTGLTYKDNLGYLKIPVSSLPTRGMFYPEGTEISIRAARGGEIKHWSTMNDQDLNQLSQVDDILNYIIEKCVSVRIPGVLGGNWKDLKDVDRFYLLLAIREFTFINGENELLVPLSEGKDMPVTKDMIDFIQIPEEIMKHYDSELRCFSFTLKSGRTFHMYIPSLGATQWLKSYAQAKANAREGFDTDFILFAPMLIGDFRRLSQRAYEEMVTDSQGWSTSEWSLIAYVRDALTAAAEAKIKYQNEDGADVTVPLTFRGGIKALFTIQDPLSILR
jgi:hypothetical protein